MSWIHRCAPVGALALLSLLPASALAAPPVHVHGTGSVPHPAAGQTGDGADHGAHGKATHGAGGNASERARDEARDGAGEMASNRGGDSTRATATAGAASPSSDPLSPRAAVPVPLHRSALAGYRPLGDRNAAAAPTWRAANDRVGRIGGWRAYLREAQQPAAPEAQP